MSIAKMRKRKESTIAKFTLVFLLVFVWTFSGWSQMMTYAVGTGDTNKISKEAVKNKFDASQMAGKYEMQGASFHKNIKADNAEKTDIKIGNETASSFEPSFEFKKWDEVRFKLTPKMETVAEADKDFDVAGDKIKYKTPKEEVHFYELADSPNLLGGGYEIERILNEKPTTNILSFDIETENLEFFYQPIYTDAEIAEKAGNEDFVNPEAMGSYAIYYKNVPLNYVGGKNYGTGKVGQIYRPRIDDSAGNWTYGELNIDVAAKKLTVTIPQSFLDTAVYPIYHASGLVFGYQTIGTAGTITIEASIKGSVFTMGTNSGAVDSITVYSNPSATGRTFGTAIYLSSSNALIANSGSTAQTPATTGVAWRTVTYATRPSLTGGTAYIIAEWGTSGTGTHVIYYDTGTANQGQTDANTGPFTWPDPLVPTGTTNKYSIYATYTPVPDAPTNVVATDGTATDKVTITWTKSSGATNYRVWRDAVDLGAAGDVATFDDTGAAAPTITAGSAVAGDGASTAQVDLSLSGASANNGTTYTYKVVASNTAGNSVDSATNTGYRGVGALTYQWQKSVADSDASYSNIGGATASTYADTGAPAPTVTAGTASATDGSATDKVTLSISGASANAGAGRYYKVILNATGATQQTSVADRGYIGVGSLTYQWNRSSGDADSGYSTLSGATTAPYDDTTAPAPTITAGAAAASDGTSADYVSLSVSGQSANVGAGRYFYATVSATGAASADTTHDRGYIGVGSLTYQWQKSAADSDASYSNIDGATTASYNDTGAPSDGSGRYFKIVENATGATQQISTSDRGYRSVLSLTFTVSTNNFSTLTPGAPVQATTTLNVNTNNTSGWNVTLSGDNVTLTAQTLISGGVEITDKDPQWTMLAATATTTAGNAVAVTNGDNVLAFRVMSASSTNSTAFLSTAWWGTSDAMFNASQLWAGIASSTNVGRIGNAGAGSYSATDHLNTVQYYLDVPATQQGAVYTGGLTYTAVVNP